MYKIEFNHLVPEYRCQPLVNLNLASVGTLCFYRFESIVASVKRPNFTFK